MYFCIPRTCLKTELFNPPDHSKPDCVASTPKRQHQELSPVPPPVGKTKVANWALGLRPRALIIEHPLVLMLTPQTAGFLFTAHKFPFFLFSSVFVFYPLCSYPLINLPEGKHNAQANAKTTRRTFRRHP